MERMKSFVPGPTRRVRELRWGILLVPVTLMTVASLGLVGANALTLVLTVLAGIVSILEPAAAFDLLPALLLGLGGWGVLLTMLYVGGDTHQVLYGAVLAGAGSWRTHLVLPQAAVFAAAGLWLLPRTDLRARTALVARSVRQSRRVRQLGRGALLVPLAIEAFGLDGFNNWTWTMAVIAGLLAILVPAIAADLVAVGCLGLGGYGVFLAAAWPELSGASHAEVLYGAVWVGDQSRALFAGAEGLLLLVFGLWLVPRTIGAHGRLAARGAVLEHQVRRLAETRTAAVDSAAAELRRVERDLHDGAQARLVALGMSLRAAEQLIQTNPEAALALVAEARETSSRALGDLRDLVRGIHPPVLADRGLGDAVRALALDTPLRADLDIDLPGRPEAPVESAAYFAAAEIVANAVKHGQARAIDIRMQHRRGVLRIVLTDDGIGGADPAKGTGLLGVEQRLAAFDGILAVSSPPGGPTIVVIEVPCALSSRRTSSC